MANKGSVLVSGQALAGGDYLASPNGQYCVVMQDDGNLVVYWGCLPDRLLGAMWASDTRVQLDEGRSGELSAALQHDGNLVVYQGGTPLWASDTSTAGNGFAAMQDDGNFVLYKGTPDSAGSPYWQTATYHGTAWVRNEGGYVAKALATGGGESGDIDVGQCAAITWPASSRASISFVAAGLQDNVFCRRDLGALRSKRYLLSGTLFSGLNCDYAQTRDGSGSF